ncbi:MAG: GNAT family N-acetyltransferase [Chloroflexota bacterium]
MTHIHYKMTCEDVDWQQLHDLLVEDEFHNGRTVAQYQLSFENSHTVVIAYADDKIIGTVRVLSDGVCNAYVVDVWTYTPYRQQGIARKMMELALEPLQGQHVYLWTDDMQAFYRAIDMVEASDHTGFYQVVGQWLRNEASE